MYVLWSQMEEAWRDSLVHKSIGYALRTTSDLYGLPWPEDETTERAWRGVLHTQALGRRGTFWTVFQSLEAALSDYNEKITYDIQVAYPYRLSCTSGNLFDERHINRYIRTPFGLLFTVGPAAGFPSTYLEVCPVGTRYWDAPSYDVDTYEAIDAPGEILPFSLYERSPGPIVVNSDDYFNGAACLLEVGLFAEAMQPPETWLADDVGAVTVSSFNTSTDVITLSSGGFSDGQAIQFSAQPGAVMPEPLEELTTYLVRDASGATFKVEESSGSGAIGLDTAGSGTIWAEAIEADPVPEGGNLLEDENVDGNTDPDHGGPFPAYLYDGRAFPSIMAVLEEHLPSGVHLSIGLAPIL